MAGGDLLARDHQQTGGVARRPRPIGRVGVVFGGDDEVQPAGAVRLTRVHWDDARRQSEPCAGADLRDTSARRSPMGVESAARLHLPAAPERGRSTFHGDVCLPRHPPRAQDHRSERHRPRTRARSGRPNSQGWHTHWRSRSDRALRPTSPEIPRHCPGRGRLGQRYLNPTHFERLRRTRSSDETWKPEYAEHLSARRTAGKPSGRYQNRIVLKTLTRSHRGRPSRCPWPQDGPRGGNHQLHRHERPPSRCLQSVAQTAVAARIGFRQAGETSYRET